MIQVQHLSKIYTDQTNVVKALDDVSFTLPSSGLIFILGKSGSGKTTLLNMLGGMDSFTSGDIKINGNSINTKKAKELDDYRNKCVGFVFQEFNLLTNYTVGSNISLALQLQSTKATREEIDDILRRVELVDADGNTLYDRKISALSGGQKQRVAIARALIKNPEIILADEPTGTLDSETSSSLLNLLKELSKDKLIVVVSHDRESAEKYADRIIELKDGKIISDTKADEEYILDFENKDAKTKNNKCKLPFGRVLTMGLAGFKKKTIRLAISIILAVFSLSIFVFAISASYADLNLTELRTTYDNGDKSVTLTSYLRREYTLVYNDGRNQYSGLNRERSFTQEQLDILSEETNIYPILAETYYEGSGDEYLYTSDLTLYQTYNPYIYFSNTLISRYIIVDEKTEASDLGLSPITDNSRLPISSDEITITDYHADLFVRLGYINDNGVVEQIDSAKDMIGKTIYNRTIVGIYSTEESLEWLQEYDKDPDYLTVNFDLSFYLGDYFYRWTQGDHMIKSALIGSDGLNVESVSKVLYILTGSANKDKKIIESVYYDEEEITENGYYTSYCYDSYSVNITSAYTGFISAASIFTNDTLIEYALVFGTVVAIFSALLLMNFLLVTTEGRKHEIGILRALGASKLDTIKICFAESGMIIIVDYLLSIVIGAITCLIINQIFNISLYSIGILPAIYLFLLCFGTIALATILPALKISRQKPINIMKE